MKRVSLVVNDEFFAFAEEMAAQGGYFGPADYLNAVLNTALLCRIDEAEEAGQLREPDGLEHDMFAELEEDPGGGMRLKDEGDEDDPDEPTSGGDLNDGIPF